MRPVQGSIQDLADYLARHPNTGLQHWTVATPGIDDREDSKWPSIGQGIMHEIHTPSLCRSGRRGGRSSVEGDMLASPHPHAELQTF